MAAQDSLFEANVADSQDEGAIVRLMRLLETRIQKRDLLQENVHEKQNHFRNILVQLENENASLKYDNNEQKKMISVLEGRVYKLQNHIDGLLCKLNNACDAMRNIQQELKNKDKQLKEHVLEKQKIIQRFNVKIQAEIDRMTEAMEMKLREQHERLTSCIKKKDDKLRLVRHILTSARNDTSDNAALTPPIASSSRIETAERTTLMIAKEEPSKMPGLQASRSACEQICQTSRARTSDIHEKIIEKSSPSLSKENPCKVTFADSQISDSESQIRQTSFRAIANGIQRKAAKKSILTTVKEFSIPSDLKLEFVEETNPTMPVDFSSPTNASTDTTIVTKIKSNTKIPIVNPRYQQVQNVDSWIDHRPARIVPIGTILQPQMQPHKRTIRKLTNPKDFMTRSSRYCLLSQEQDTDGELETKLYKANVLPTCGGGAQIIFNDIECLKQISPTTAKHNGQIKLENNPVNKSCVDCQKSSRKP